MNPKRLRRLLSSAICITETAFLYCNSNGAGPSRADGPKVQCRSNWVVEDFTNRRNVVSGPPGTLYRDDKFYGEAPDQRLGRSVFIDREIALEASFNAAVILFCLSRIRGVGPETLSAPTTTFSPENNGEATQVAPSSDSSLSRLYPCSLTLASTLEYSRTPVIV